MIVVNWPILLSGRWRISFKKIIFVPFFHSKFNDYAKICIGYPVFASIVFF